LTDLSKWTDRVVCGDALEVLRGMPDGCAALAIVDGPYNMRKADWDKFDSWYAFRDWYRPLWEQLSRVLRDNCSLYVFGTFESLAALKMDLDAAGPGWRFVNHIVLRRESLYLKKFDQARFRSWLPEHYEDCLLYARETVDISDMAWREVTQAHGVGCDGTPIDDNPLRAYLNAERERAGVSVREVAEAFQQVTGSRTVTGMAGHWFGNSQWTIPTAENYQWLRALFNSRGNGSGPYLVRPWEDLRREYEDLRREYEDLRREYEDLRYTFNPQQGVTDVWTVPICAGSERVRVNGQTAHVAQKPLEIMRRIIQASSNEGDTVVVPCSGLGSAEVACVETGRHYIGIELNPEYVAIAERRIAEALRKHHPTLAQEAAE